MSKLEEAKEILSSLKVPAKQQNGMCSSETAKRYVLLCTACNG